MGAVTGDHSFLKIVMNATTRPPIAPTMIQGPATEGSSAVRTCAHTHAAGRTRSEEHTSELQSQSNLVCRLLLEKKKHTLPIALRLVSTADIQALAIVAWILVSGCSARPCLAPLISATVLRSRDSASLSDPMYPP